MGQHVQPVNGTELKPFNEVTRNEWGAWRGLMGPPVPVVINADIWQRLIEAILETDDPIKQPRVFRLFMRRGKPRRVVEATEIQQVYRNERGTVRWTEGRYPPKTAPLRKGGNAFIRGDVQLTLRDAWWMGREQTDLRILLAEVSGEIQVAAWWSRAGTSGLSSKHETDGELWPVRLLIG
ncbi:MAG TPA: hypothetical protein ENI39_08395 [Anaerolineae bacterium]|nr:hypothetical protein [Anaerolineae bacterium]